MNANEKKCPEDGLSLSLLGSVGIVHWDDVWEAETMRYKCPNGHMIFIADEETTKAIDEAEDNERAEKN
jgi:hypothetical protein